MESKSLNQGQQFSFRELVKQILRNLGLEQVARKLRESLLGGTQSSGKSLGLSDHLSVYLQSTSLREHESLAQLRQETEQHPFGIMQTPPEEGQFIALLIQLIGAKKTLEVGVFTGYSTLAVALALPPDGKIIACDISEEDTAIARRYWQKAGVAHKIDLHLAPALSTLDRLLAEGSANTFDFAFIDADKQNYDNYYERLLQLVRPGGLIAIDNVLWAGRVADPANQEAETTAIRSLNQKIHHDSRVVISLLPIADGLTLAMKKT
ncbi:methyltransferase domain-containing protein [Myxacorys almedinensis A]|uniref:Methyltransferase domain-containing protein n=1 Tax=Myxacorys almedinensis A TaxID=2690445 RepID=A0A8J7Z2Q8_9CYAN|nr:methyltransferase domain-containing protein [Myxacorys almedinensis A]